MSTFKVDVGTGTRITFHRSRFSGEVTGASHDGRSRPEIMTHHLLSEVPPPGSNKFGGITKRTGRLQDPGNLSLELHFDPGDLVPINQDPEPITVEYPPPKGKSVGAKLIGEGFMSSDSTAVQLEDKMTQSVTLSMSGIWEHIPAK